METEILTQSKLRVLRQNTHGYWYSIPESMVDEFVHLDETQQNTEFGSTEWEEACHEFDRVFESYRRE
jgi:hypothetical protein